MNLSTTSQLADLHPYMAWAIGYILEVAEAYGGRYTITSVTRTAKQQWDLYNSLPTRAARPGCSQHQYGAAIDVLFEETAWQNWWQQAARYFGLTTVSGDPVHVQLIPGADFLRLVEGRDVCPDPTYFRESFPLLGGLVDKLCGTGFTGYQIREGVVTCLPQRQITSLIGE